MSHPVVLISLAAATASMVLPAQRTLVTNCGNVGDSLGRYVAAAGDANRDGVPDLVTTSRNDYVRLISGADGSTLQQVPVSQEKPVTGGLDLDADGHADFVADDPPRIFSGRTGQVLATTMTLPFWYDGRVVVEDLNGDGRRDLVVTNSRSGGTVEAYSGADATLLWGSATLAGADADVVSLPDVNADGVEDVLLRQNFSVNQAVILSGKTGVSLGNFGSSIDAIGRLGDVDGDGTDDYATADWEAVNPSNGFPGVVTVYSGATRTKLFDIGRPHPGRYEYHAQRLFGAAICNAGDPNQDGFDDIAIGEFGFAAGVPAGGTIWTFSGRDRSVLTLVEPHGPGYMISMAAAGDVDADGLPDLITGAASSVQSLWQGCVHVISGEILAGTTTRGPGCGGGPFLPRLASTRPVLGLTATLVGDQVPPSSHAGLVLFSTGGTPPLPINLSVPDCDLYLEPATTNLFLVVPPQDWTRPIPIPNAPTLTGAHVSFQAVYLDTVGPLGFDLTNGLGWQIGT